MPIAKQKACGAATVMKPEVANDTLDTFIKQAIGKEPSVSFSRTGDSPIQWIQLLNALEQQDLPGWPLLSPVKMQLQKCEKCSREFCSTINYRRHTRLHRRSLNLDRDSTDKTRELLRAFWDKLSAEEGMEIVSFKDVTLEEVPGHSIIKALTSFIRKPRFSSLPPSYIKAGAALLDIVQAQPSRFPTTSEELFNILDDASEKTFLCAGKAESLQKYVFDGEAGKIGLEMRNVVACTSFLIEQKLVKSWLADKDAESLRYQKLLVDEEDAAQKRHAELLERKRKKKLRQQEQKAKAQTNGRIADSQEDSADISDSSVLSPLVLSPIDPSGSTSHIPDLLQNAIPLSHEPNQRLISEDDESNELLSGSDFGCSEGHGQVVEHRILCRNSRVHTSNLRWHVQKLPRGSNGYHAGQNVQGGKLGTMQKHAFYWDSRSTSLNNANKVWTPKMKSENDEESCRTRLHIEETRVSDENKNLEVLIGSISVAIGNCVSQPQEEQLGTLRSSDIEPPVRKSSLQGKPDNHSVAKLWRPVSRHDGGGRNPVCNAHDNSEMDGVGIKVGQDSLQSCHDDSNNGGHRSDSVPAVEGGHLGALRFSSCAAEAFLAQRWKEAIASVHVDLVVIPETEPPGCNEVQNQCPSTFNREKQVPHAGAVKIKSKYRLQIDSATKVRYITKRRSVA